MADLLVALDLPELDAARRTVETLLPLGVRFKVGYEAYYRYGAELLAFGRARGARFMLDLKLHDIPRTVAAAVEALAAPGVELLTVHALGGERMLRAAVEAAEAAAARAGTPAPAVFAVTLLTSVSELELPEIGLTGGAGENVVRLAALARNAGCRGVVCSAHEVADLKAYFGRDFAALCPGIRPAGAAAQDQRRVATPAQAVAAGADHLVVGRPIVAADDPAAAARAVLDQMEARP